MDLYQMGVLFFCTISNFCIIIALFRARDRIKKLEEQRSGTVKEFGRHIDLMYELDEKQQEKMSAMYVSLESKITGLEWSRKTSKKTGRGPGTDNPGFSKVKKDKK